MMCMRRGRPDVFRTVWQGYWYGRRSPQLLAVDWEPLLSRSLDDVRAELALPLRPDYPLFHMADAPGAPDELPPQSVA